MVQRISSTYQLFTLDEQKLLAAIRAEGYEIEPASDTDLKYNIMKEKQRVGKIDRCMTANIFVRLAPGLDKFLENYDES